MTSLGFTSPEIYIDQRQLLNLGYADNLDAWHSRARGPGLHLYFCERQSDLRLASNKSPLGEERSRSMYVARTSMTSPDCSARP